MPGVAGAPYGGPHEQQHQPAEQDAGLDALVEAMVDGSELDDLFRVAEAAVGLGQDFLA